MKITICAQLDLNFESVPRFPSLRPAGRQNRRRNLGSILWQGLGLRRRHRREDDVAGIRPSEAGALVRYNQLLS